jgi:hypothetical protein
MAQPTGADQAMHETIMAAHKLKRIEAGVECCHGEGTEAGRSEGGRGAASDAVLQAEHPAASPVHQCICKVHLHKGA